jgi:hypothetical protein
LEEFRLLESESQAAAAASKATACSGLGIAGIEELLRRSLGKQRNVPRDTVAALFADISDNHDDVLTYREFCAYVKRRQAETHNVVPKVSVTATIAVRRHARLPKRKAASNRSTKGSRQPCPASSGSVNPAAPPSFLDTLSGLAEHEAGHSSGAILSLAAVFQQPSAASAAAGLKAKAELWQRLAGRAVAAGDAAAKSPTAELPDTAAAAAVQTRTAQAVKGLADPSVSISTTGTEIKSAPLTPIMPAVAERSPWPSSDTNSSGTHT